MIKVKISCQGSTIARSNHFNPMIAKFLPDGKNIWKDCEFYWNDDNIKEADYWIVIGDVNNNQEQCLVTTENVILMTGEPPAIKKYDQYPDFIKQFGRIYTCHTKVNHSKVFSAKPPINWWIDAGHPIKTPSQFNEWEEIGFGYNDFKNMEYQKTKLISVFCSNKTFTPGHKQRFEFCKKLKKHFGDRLDWFGSGVNPIDSKWSGIAPYKYHISLENCNYPNYWTEKLMDCYMAGTYPIYSGAKNIDQYFQIGNQITTIDLNYPKLAIAKIEKIISDKLYENNLQNLINARNLVMDKYNFFNIIAEICKNDNKTVKKELKIIKSEEFFAKKDMRVFVKNKKNIFRRIVNSLGKKIRKIKFYILDNFLLIKFKLGLLK